MPETFICDNCGGVFPMGDDDESQDELRTNFGDVNPSACAMVCDGCYAEMVA